MPPRKYNFLNSIQIKSHKNETNYKSNVVDFIVYKDFIETRESYNNCHRL